MGEQVQRWTPGPGASHGGWMGIQCSHSVCAKLISRSYNPMDYSYNLSKGFSRQEDSSGLPCPPPGDPPNPGIKPMFLMSPALAGGFLTTSAIWGAQHK